MTQTAGDVAAPVQTADASLPPCSGRVVGLSDDRIELAFPGTDYRLYLAVEGRPAAGVGQRVTGRIRARARRVDVVGAGGRFVEPVIGRPRRIQGRIIGGDPAGNRLFIHCGGPVFICDLTAPRQQAGDFALGQLAACDVESGARFDVV